MMIERSCVGDGCTCSCWCTAEGKVEESYSLLLMMQKNKLKNYGVLLFTCLRGRFNFVLLFYARPLHTKAVHCALCLKIIAKTIYEKIEPI